MTDHDVIFNCFCTIGEAGLLYGTVINVSGPAVRLDTNGDIDLRYFQSAADIADGVVVLACSADGRVLRRHGSHARIQTALGISAVRIGIGILEGSQAVSIQESIDRHLII